MKAIAAVLLVSVLALTVRAQQPSAEPRIKELERKLDQATAQIAQLGGLIQSLRAEVSRLKERPAPERHSAAPGAEITAPQTPPQPSPPAETAASEFAACIIDPDLGGSEREETLAARPEIFIQTRYAAFPIRNAGTEFEPNLSLTRIETRWAASGCAPKSRRATLLQRCSASRRSSAFRPGARSAGGHLFVTYRLTDTDQLYARYDQFNRDPVTGGQVRAFNFGYFRQLSAFSRVSFDYQFKNRPSFNDECGQWPVESFLGPRILIRRQSHETHSGHFQRGVAGGAGGCFSAKHHHQLRPGSRGRSAAGFHHRLDRAGQAGRLDHHQR
jgi:hypothetical protein